METKWKARLDATRKWILANLGPVVVVGVVCAIYAAGVGYITLTTIAEHPRMERLGWWSQTIATVIAILAAFFVAVQVGDIKRAGRTAAFEATAARMQDIARLLLAHPEYHLELRLGGRLSVEAELLAESLLDNIDTELLRQRVLPDHWEDALPTLEIWYKDLFREMPGLRQTLDKRKTWYSDEIYVIREAAEHSDKEWDDRHPAPVPPSA